ncbi:MAG TPA: hypothetical protein VGM03_13615 [Phycisphaerae bacterium]
MASYRRDIAKFLAGFAANETIGHWWVGIWGTDLFPMKIGGFTFTSTINTFAMIVWPIVLIALVYYAWFYKGQSGRVPSPSAHSVAAR